MFFPGSNCVVPINDIRGVESMGYAKGEKILRCKLASAYRLMDLYGWTQGVYNQISVSGQQLERDVCIAELSSVLIHNTNIRSCYHNFRHMLNEIN